jgi:hypothetical protein
LSFLARDLAEKVPLAWATRATRVFFLYHFQGISRVLLFFSIQWHSSNFMDF